jgi:DMSO/TMAO reductase YedYZ molybdopterin-dependent catalytic subunit
MTSSLKTLARGIKFCLALAFICTALTSCQLPSTPTSPSSTVPSPPPEIEATEYNGLPLTPIVQQPNNALKGTQYIDRESYRLTVDGLVEHPLSLSYDDLLAYPQATIYTDLNCVDGWDFLAKWTGPKITSIFDAAGVQAGALIAIFYTTDAPSGYTSLDLQYLRDKHTILGMKDNDISLPAERGFPFQVIADNKFGYKWAKWVTRIELSANAGFRGYWEGHGYNNDASVGGPRFEP